MEADFAFGWMYVDVNQAGVHFDEQKGDGVLAFHQGCVVALTQGVLQNSAFDGSPIQKDRLQAAVTAAEPGFANEAMEAQSIDGLIGNL